MEKDGKTYQTVTEGKATILVPHGAKVGEDKGEVQQVFYNPIQQFNRDLSVLAIKAYGEEILERRKEQFFAKRNKVGKKRKRDEKDVGNEDAAKNPDEATTEKPQQTEGTGVDASVTYTPSFKILDALSASGLRALRYGSELPFVTSVTANDLSPSAAESIKANVVHNGLEDKVHVTNDDALALMYRGIADDLTNKDRMGNPSKSNKFDVIDLDPYGTAAPFLDAAVQSIRFDGGLLCITCTDSAVWAGHSYCEKTYALYGGIPVKGVHSHEVGLRLILNAIATSAARYGLNIEPLLSLSIDYYTKVFVRVNKSQQAVKFLGAKTMLAYSCDQGCGAWKTQHLMRSKPTPNKKGEAHFYKHVTSQGPTSEPHCEHCGTKTHITGPMYGGRLHSPEFVQRVLDQIPNADKSVYSTLPRVEGMLRTALEEYLPGPEVEEKVPPKDAEAAAIDPYPFFVIPNRLSSVISCISLPDDMFRGALLHLGYRVTRSHCKAGSIKTDAPWSTIWWVMTEWVRQKAPIKAANIKVNSAAYKILSDAGVLSPKAPEDQDTKMNETARNSEEEEVKIITDDTQNNGQTENGPGTTEIPTEMELRKTLVFNEKLARLGHQSAGQKLLRYQSNPEKNWGPLAKAKPQ